MRRELLLLEEMIDAAEQAHLLAAGQTLVTRRAEVSRTPVVDVSWTHEPLHELGRELCAA